MVMVLSKVFFVRIIIRLGQQVIFSLRIRLSRRILATPLPQLEQTGIHRLFPALTDDILVISNALASFPLFCTNCVTVVVCFAYLAWLSLPVILLTLTFFLVGVSAFQIIIKAAQRAFRAAREEEDRLFRHLRSLTEGIKELQLHQSRRKAFVDEILMPTSQMYRQQMIRGMSLFSVANRWGESLFLVCLGFLLFGLAGPFSLSHTIIIGTILVVLYTQGPLDMIMNTLPLFSQARVALTTLETLGLAEEPAVATDEGKQTRQIEGQQLSTTMTLTKVTYSYWNESEGSHFTLGPIDLSLRAGEVTFLVGGNGSGKTTLGRVLVGLYPPTAGTIHLNGTLINDEKREWYRQHFSTVFSDYYLFESLLGHQPSNDLTQQANSYLKLFQLHHKVSFQNTTFSTLALSQGQRKRLALLVAYLEDRPVYVFDEWAADQDPLFKHIFYTQVLSDLKRRGKVVLAITHDDQYFHCADRLVKLDYGKIVALPRKNVYPNLATSPSRIRAVKLTNSF
jgi:putative ATP-binding cassette transporter